MPRHVLISPLVEFMPVECNALFADWYIRDMWSNLGVEPVAIHAEVIRRIADSEKARFNVCHNGGDIRRALAACRRIHWSDRRFRKGVRAGVLRAVAARMCPDSFYGVHTCTDICVPRTLLPGLIPQ